VRRARAALILVLAGVALLAGCGHSGSAGRPATDQNVTLTLRTVPGLGTFLVTHGWTLYLYPPDQQRRVTCTRVEQCETAWPPLFVTSGHKVLAGPGVNPALISTVPGDGGEVVAYNHWPLYYYVGDRQPKQINGQGNGFDWYVVSPDGSPNKRPYSTQ
jgi:predicted lipoprotein with Yx(FWY)xxD motif